MPLYVNGQVPVSVSTMQATVGVQTPYIQQGVGARSVAVPNPAANDTFVVLSGVQTMSAKTLVLPTIQSGVFSGVNISDATENNTVNVGPPVTTLNTGVTKTLDMLVADAFILDLTGPCTLTITHGTYSKFYTILVKQNVANSHTNFSWMTGFLCASIASGASPRTGSIDVWQVYYNATDGKHYAVGAKDVQG